MKKTGFSISNRNNSVGFRISLDHGYEVSVAFGDDTTSGDTKIMEGRTGTDYFCEKAEIVVLNDKNQPIPFIKNNKKTAVVEPKDILQIIAWASKR